MNPTAPMPKPNQDDLLKSIQEIYKYIYKNFVDSNSADLAQKQRLQLSFQDRECLWDEETQRFWQPKHAFEEDVPFFGNRRVTIPFSHKTGEVYRLLGQKSRPKVDDYRDFLQELSEEYQSSPLTEEDQDCVLQVLKKLSLEALEDRSVQDIPLLTEAGTLRPAKKTLIPDAPWWHDYISDKNILCHRDVSVALAKSAGSLSLLINIIPKVAEQPQADHSNIQVNGWCNQWQNALNSEQFSQGVRRILYHQTKYQWEGGIKPDLKVIPAKKINITLLINDIAIATNVPGDYYFDETQRIYYVKSGNSKETMLGYLAESFNNRLRQIFKGKQEILNLLPLVRILDTEPSNINNLLYELRIRSLPGDVDEPSDTNSIEPAKPDSSTTEEETTQASEQDIKAYTRTNTGKGENPVYWGEFGEKWARQFYKLLGYNSIKKQEPREGFDFLCEENGKPTIKAEVKAITSTSPNLRITKNEWSKMVEIGESYELLIVSHQGESVDKIIQVKHLWKTLQNDFFAKLGEKNLTTWAGEEAEVLLGFNLNSDKSQNHVVLCWHRLCEGNHSDNIKRYRPVNSENQEVKFELIP